MKRFKAVATVNNTRRAFFSNSPKAAMAAAKRHVTFTLISGKPVARRFAVTLADTRTGREFVTVHVYRFMVALMATDAATERWARTWINWLDW